jgi:hypothetical protein
VAVALAATVGLVGCGKGKGDDIAKVMSGMSGGSGVGLRGGEQGTVDQHVRAQARAMYAQAKGNAWLMRFRAESGQFNDTGLVASYGTEYGCSTTGTTASKYVFSCTMQSNVSFDCKGTTYTVAQGGTWGLTIDGIGGSTYTISMDLSATVSGGDLDATALSCHFGFTIDVAKLQDADDSNDDITIDCNNSANKCTFGDETFGCSDFESEKENADNSC